MSMERRALLAFVASMLLFLAYDALYLSPHMKKAKEERARQIQQHQLADSLAGRVAQHEQTPPPPTTPPQASTPAPVPPAAPATTVPETLAAVSTPADTTGKVVIVSDLYRITIRTLGAEITSAKLLKYDTDQKPVELFAPAKRWEVPRPFHVTLMGESTSVDLHAVPFTATVEGQGGALPDSALVTVDKPTTLVFRATTRGGRTIERRYQFQPDSYVFRTSVRFDESAFPNVEGVQWDFGPGMTTTEDNIKDDERYFRASVLLGAEFHRHKPHDFTSDRVDHYSGTLSWATLQTKYFMTGLIPLEPTRADVTMSGDKSISRITGTVTLPVTATRGSVDQAVNVYMGPLDVKTLKGVGVGLEKNVEMGWRWLRPLSQAVLWAMIWLYKIIPNYGWVIIIISVLTKVAFFRLTHKSFKSMKDLQALQPRIQALKEKYGDDKQKLSQETMKLYKEAGVNPLGGCLPMLLQMPVFVALFNVLRYTIELRGAHFVGWITDLSRQDVLFHLPISLPFIGDAFSLLPILMGVSMWAQSKLGGSPTGGPSQATPPGFQTMLPIVFTVLFYRMPSGLVIYWIINTVLSVAQQYYIHQQPDENEALGSQANTKASKADGSASGRSTSQAAGRSRKRRLKAKER